jgi:hypothetical protein
MDKQKLIYAGIALGSAFVASLATAIYSAPSDLEILDKCATMPAQDLKDAARKTVEQINAVNKDAAVLNARKTVILAVQDANS